MRKLTPLQNLIFQTGGILLLVGLVLWIPRIAWAPYVYCVGSLLFAAMQLLAGYEGRNFVIRRLRRQQIFGALMLILTGAVMVGGLYHMPYCSRNEWILTLLIAAILEIYTAFRIPAELKKEG